MAPSLTDKHTQSHSMGDGAGKYTHLPHPPSKKQNKTKTGNTSDHIPSFRNGGWSGEVHSPSETQGQIVGRGKVVTGEKKNVFRLFPYNLPPGLQR